jgi:hypothetical protein
MLSPKQKGIYWSLWSGVLKARNWQHLSSNERDLRRYAFHRENDLPESMTAFNRRDHFDTFKAACERVIKGEGPSATTAAEDGERKRLIWRIREDAKAAGLDPAYLAKLSTDLTGLACWDELAIDDLTNFRDAIHNRASTRLGQDTRTVTRRRMTLDPDKKFTPAPQPEPAYAHADPDNEPF